MNPLLEYRYQLFRRLQCGMLILQEKVYGDGSKVVATNFYINILQTIDIGYKNKNNEIS